MVRDTMILMFLCKSDYVNDVELATTVVLLKHAIFWQIYFILMTFKTTSNEVLFWSCDLQNVHVYWHYCLLLLGDLFAL